MTVENTPNQRDETIELVTQIRDGLRKLGELHGRKFTLDGHAVGSLGEVVAASLFGLELMPASNTGYDAVEPETGQKVEIKATFGKSVAFRPTARAIADLHVIVLNLNADSPEEMVVFNGPYAVLGEVIGEKYASNGQKQVSINRLKALQARVAVRDELTVVGLSMLHMHKS